MIKQTKYKIKNHNGEYDTIHFETSSDLVLIGDTVLTDKITEIEDKLLLNDTHEFMTEEDVQIMLDAIFNEGE